jgi:hypothetical protein
MKFISLVSNDDGYMIFKFCIVNIMSDKDLSCFSYLYFVCKYNIVKSLIMSRYCLPIMFNHAIT